MTGAIVYILCALTSGLCAVLLLRAYFRQRNRLLFWSGAAFCVFGLANILLFVDLVATPPSVDLSAWRSAITLVGVCLLLWGLVWESAS